MQFLISDPDHKSVALLSLPWKEPSPWGRSIHSDQNPTEPRGKPGKASKGWLLDHLLNLMPGEMQVNPTLVLGLSGLPAFLAGCFFGWFFFLVVAGKKGVSKDKPVRGWSEMEVWGVLQSFWEPALWWRVSCGLFSPFLSVLCYLRCGPVSFLEKMRTGVDVVLGRATSSLCTKIRPFPVTFYGKQLVKAQPRGQFCEELKPSCLILWEKVEKDEWGGSSAPLRAEGLRSPKTFGVFWYQLRWKKATGLYGWSWMFFLWDLLIKPFL